jgi:UV DNA damage endonuclease
MKIGYPARNLRIGCTPAHTFRLGSYREERFRETIAQNLDCLEKTLQYNAQHGLRFFRIGSDIIPFASHPVCGVRWWEEFAGRLAALGEFIRRERFRISMHPGQFTIVNTADDALFANTVAELVYHDRLMRGLCLDDTHKVQIHVGGIYGDKAASLDRFAARFAELPDAVQRRLVIENDDRLFTLADCLTLHERIGVPLVFDNLHHHLHNRGESVLDAFAAARATWHDADGETRRHGVPMMDYSDPDTTPGARTGKHAQSVNAAAFAALLVMVEQHSPGADYDVMLELKDKEGSALAARPFAATLQQFVH